MTDQDAGLAILGGTFDPIHNGHIESAIAVKERLAVAAVKLVPSFIPPHKLLPGTSAAHRLEMIRIATEKVDGIEVDDREISREGVSYTFNTLASFRRDIGVSAPLYFVLGVDSYATLNTWHRWRELTESAHLLVLKRAGFVGEIPGEVKRWAEVRQARKLECLQNSAGGLVCQVELTQLEVSATYIRQVLGHGGQPDGLMPQSVVDYARQHGLYADS